jgi:diguanylate cyclase (GGDEF)-like protein/PAS domain S-box-containing protein
VLDAILIALLSAGGVYAAMRRHSQRALGQAARHVEEVRASEARFRALTELSADWFWETDAEHRITWISCGGPVAAFLGRTPTYGRRFWELCGMEIDRRALEAIRARLEQRLIFDLEIARTDERGARQIHVISGQAHFDAGERFLGYRGVGHDVTEQRRASRVLGHAKERLELALEAGSLAEWDLYVESDELYLGQGWRSFLGREPLARITSGADWLALVHPEDRAAVRKAYVEVITARSTDYRLEYRVRAGEGGWKWLAARGRVTERSADGRARRVSGTVADIDEHVRAAQALRDTEQRYRSLIELAPDGVLVFQDSVIEYVNPAAARLLGASPPGRLIGMRLEALVHPDERERLAERVRQLSEAPGTTVPEPWRLITLEGREITVEGAGASFPEQGRTLVQAVFRDITERQLAREAIAEREQRFRDVVDVSGEFVWETDAKGRYTYLSERAEAVLGYTRAELLGHSPRDFLPLGEERVLENWYGAPGAEGRRFRDVTHRSITKSGRAIWLAASGTPLRDAAGRFAGYRGTAADVTAGKQAEARIEFLATRDALTGLPNRLLLADRANQAIAAAARSRRQVALLCIDLDRFKLVNESLGHEAGDALLRLIAGRLQETLRREEMLARLGGDEFVLLWDEPRSAEDAGVLAQRVLGILARPFAIEGQSLNVSASVGISLYPGDGHDFSELLKNAEAAMHHAKENGRATFRFFSPGLNARALQRLRLENELRRALSRGELVLHWQPVLRGRPAGGHVVGAEALVRWQHPERGLLMPGEFVPIAEECGLIRAIGEWILERALSQAGAWQRLHPRCSVWFAVNVSAAELCDADAYFGKLKSALRENGLHGGRVELEVTERVLMSNLGQHAHTLRRIGELGVRFAIDDFGTGYSSLAYLRRLPIDKLKIDRSFLGELDTHAADAAIVRAIAVMAKTLGIAVAAEGVESEAQLARLLALGCEEWQGHYFSRPLEAPAFERLFSGALAAVRS